MKKYYTLIIGSGAAGLACAVRLHAQGVENIVIYTEGLQMGTSINTGSDKQTYYKLGMYGREPDSPVLMAEDLASGGSVHGDLALTEAALSPLAFAHLVTLGVPFPHDGAGQYIGYKTDHDPKRRATSCGPYTSRDMCRVLIGEVRRRNIPVVEQADAVRLLTDRKKQRVIGAVFLRNGTFETVSAENVVFAVGGPGGLYETSVYPAVHTGAVGLALEAGAKAYNLAESQFGLASTKFRWNVSGSYMQVLPRFISTDQAGGDEREFLREYFDSPAAMYDAVFLKGYQWPFSAVHVPGSSLIDIFTYVETVERGRRVFLDYRHDPADFMLDELNSETKDYLLRSGAWADSPLKRLEKLNAPAIALYRQHGIDLAAEPLEIAVCAQHNNGGLAGNLWWESVNLKHLFPVGEVNGSHGVTRPGGSALNAGQAGAFRAAEWIANQGNTDLFPENEFLEIAEEENAKLLASQKIKALRNWREERKELQRRMSASGAFIRKKEQVAAALAEARRQYRDLCLDGLGGLDEKALREALRNRHLCFAQVAYLECILKQTEEVGSRGGSIVLGESGTEIHSALSWNMMEEKKAYRNFVMTWQNGTAGWEPCRPVPEQDGWFETVWGDFRSGKIYQQQKED